MSQSDIQRLVIVTRREKSANGMTASMRTYLHERRRALITELRTIEKLLECQAKRVDNR